MSNSIIQEMQFLIRKEILSVIECNIPEDTETLREMLRYPLGLESPADSPGKQLRPVILLLACHGLGGIWKKAIPAAVSLELIHNFSLVHDDIQDNSPTRRGRDSAWKRYGIGQAINIGDLMFTLANMSINNLSRGYSPEIVNEAARVLQIASIELIHGQYLDLSYEKDDKVILESYWRMVDGKTGALFSAAFGLAALLAGKQPDPFCQLGILLGRAFQVQDDWLGLWGVPEVTGKPIYSDILDRKKSFPIIMALTMSDEFKDRWYQRAVLDETDAVVLLDMLNKLGIGKKSQQITEDIYQQVLSEYSRLFPDEMEKGPLLDTIISFFNRAT